MSEPTKGLRLEFEPGICGLKFVSEEESYPEANGPTDMAYINSLIETEQGRRCRECGRLQDPSAPCQCCNDE